jgi:hypothetical protein
VLGAAVVALLLAAAASADHISATYSATATLGERVGNSWRVTVQWSIVCNGTSSPSYFGDLSLVEQGGAGQSFYLGGTAGASGTSTASIPMKDTPRVLKPRLKASCADSVTLHGSNTQEYFGSEVAVPALRCDPDLLAKALREYDVAESFYNAAIQDLRHADEKAKKTLLEKLKTKAFKKALKKELKLLIAVVSEDAAAAVSVVGAWVKIGVLIQKILLDVLPALNETRKRFNEAEKDFQRAGAWRERAEADLAAALKQGPCTGELRSKLDQALDEQRRQRAAHDLIDTWESNGYLYLNPATGETLDEAAALKEARRILDGSVRTPQSRSLSTPRRIMATRRQIQAALAKVTRSEVLGDRVQVRVQRADAAADRLRARLGPLIR